MKTISRKDLQELVSRKKSELELYTNIWNKHVDQATEHIKKLIIDAALLGRLRITFVHFSNCSANLMLNKWKTNIMFSSGVKYNGDYYATYIAEECLEDIATKLKSIFVDCEIGVWYSGIQHDYSPKLLIKW